MFVGETNIRVRYADTDQMGYVYYGKYAEYYEVGRTELLRELDLSYREFEEQGILLPVREMKIKYYKAARYDDLLRIVTKLEELPSARIRFVYEVYNQNDEQLNTGEVTLVFTNAKTRRPTKPPEVMITRLEPFYTK
jgi:acyl-CoA thioester hydrolase